MPEKDSKVEIRMSAEEKALLKRLARQQHMDTSEYVRFLIHRGAREEISRQDQLVQPPAQDLSAHGDQGVEAVDQQTVRAETAAGAPNGERRASQFHNGVIVTEKATDLEWVVTAVNAIGGMISVRLRGGKVTRSNVRAELFELPEA